MEMATGLALRWWALAGRGRVKEVGKMLKEEEEVRLGLFSHNNTLLCRSFFAVSPPLGLKLDIFHSLKVLNDLWPTGSKSD